MPSPKDSGDARTPQARNVAGAKLAAEFASRNEWPRSGLFRAGRAPVVFEEPLVTPDGVALRDDA